MSTVPAALTNLAALIDTVMPKAVHTGPPIKAESQSYVIVGYDPAGGPSVEPTAEWSSLGRGAREERYEIACALVVWSGDDTFDIAGAYTLFTLVDKAVSGSTLNGTVRLANVASHAVTLERSEFGQAVSLTFRVACQARI